MNELNEEQFPDQSLFEPEPIEEGSIRGPFFKYLKWAIGITFIVAMIYLGGVYHFFLLDRTPESATSQEYESLIDKEEITIPVNVYVIEREDSENRSPESIQRLVENADKIWGQANIRLNLENIIPVSLEEGDQNQIFRNPGTYLSEFPLYDPEKLSIILVHNLSGLNGVAYGGLRTVSVAEYTSHFDFRTLAHEVGHILGLSHTNDTSRLMSQGSFGEIISKEEALRAHFKAQDLNE